MNLNLENLTIASPCTAEWNAMTGDDRVRHCPQCKLNVYNLSELSRPQAEQLLKEKEGKLCVRYYQRHDGTILTKNCPAALRRAQQALQRMVAAIAGLFGLVLSGATGCIKNGGALMGSAAVPTTQRTQIQPRDDRSRMGRVTMRLPQPTTQQERDSEARSPETSAKRPLQP